MRNQEITFGTPVTCVIGHVVRWLITGLFTGVITHLQLVCQK